MADSIVGDASVSNSKMALITEIAQRELAASIVIKPYFSDVSGFAEKGLDRISFPRYSSFSVTKKTSGTAIDAASLTEGVDTLLLDQEAVVQWLIEKKASTQTRVRLEAEYAARAASAHGRQVENDMLDELIAGADTGNDVEFVAALTRENILDMNLNLDKQYVPKNDRVLIVSSTQYRELLNISDFIDASKFGGGAPVMTGQIGMIYGIPVVVSQELENIAGAVSAGNGATHAIMAHKEGLAIGFQIDPMFLQDEDLPNLADRYSLSQLYGVKALNNGDMIALCKDAAV